MEQSLRPVAAGLAWALAGTALAVWTAWFFMGRVIVFEVSPLARLEV